MDRSITDPHDAREARLRLPAGGTGMSVSTPRGPLAVTTLGLSTSARWFVFVPGFLASKEDFYGVMAALGKRGVGSVSFDLRGSQDSAPATNPDHYSLDAQADDVLAVVDAVAHRWNLGPGHVVGHSMGGLLAQRAAKSRSWASVTLLCSGPAALPPHRAGVLPLIRRFVTSVDRDTLWDRKLGLERAAGVSALAPEVAEFERRRWSRNDDAALVAGATALMEADAVDPPAPIPPMLVVWGERDDGWPIPQQCSLADRWGAGTAQIPGAGHQPHLDAPTLLAELLLSRTENESLR